MEVFLHLYGESEDARCVANTRLVKEEPIIMILGQLKEFPALELAVKSMKMGEKSTFKFSPEYTYFSKDKYSKCDPTIISHLKPEMFKTDIAEKKTEEEIKKMEIEDAKKYQNLYYDIELVKFDKPRPRKTQINPQERLEQAGELKLEGNDLFKEKRFMEAIVKYEDARDYLKHLPNEFITDQYHILQNSLTLNITNCRINLSQYNYALKNLEENFVFKKTPKAFYFKSLCQMHLGDFESSYKNLLELQKVLPDEKQMKAFFNEYYKFKEETIKQQKDRFKKGIFQSGLYKDKKDEEKKEFSLPKLNAKENPCFYIDFLINGDEMNPKKIKFEIFKTNENLIYNTFEFIKNEIKNKNIVGKELKFDFSTDEYNNIIMFEKIKEEQTDDKFDEINKYPINEDVLLLIHRANGHYNIEITARKISDIPIKDYIAFGRSYYNQRTINKLFESKSKGILKIIDIDETFNY